MSFPVLSLHFFATFKNNYYYCSQNDFYNMFKWQVLSTSSMTEQTWAFHERLETTIEHLITDTMQRYKAVMIFSLLQAFIYI